MMRRRSAVLAFTLLAGYAVVAATQSSATLTDPCLSPPPVAAPGTVVIEGLTNITGTSGDDQIIGTEGPDVIYGMDGADVIKGLGGDDVLCGGDGRDGVNGGPGNDWIGGGVSQDLLVGHDGADTVWGGADSDGIYGGAGGDIVYGDDDGTTYDYLVGGPDADTMNPGVDDESHNDGGATTTCPAAGARWLGVYGTNSRLRLYDPDRPCRTYTGTVVSAVHGADGDRGFELETGADNHLISVDGRTVGFELMPRDEPALGGLSNGTTVTVTGLFVADTWKRDKPEIHPIYSITLNGATHHLGPRLAGSPYKLNPPTVLGSGPRARFCWNALGRACEPYDATDTPFSLDDRLVDAATAAFVEYQGGALYR